MSEKLNDFRQLTVWQKSHLLVLEIYKITRRFPAGEKFGLVSQMRRAVVSVAANIAEGFKKRGIKDKLNFYNISQSSLEELRYYLILSRDLGYQFDFQAVWDKTEEVSRLLIGLIQSIRKSRGVC